MKHFAKLSLAAMMLACCHACANGPAGTILYARDGGNVHLLLADHADSKRGWAAFGGSHEPGESTAETAARETEEETRGYFARAELLERISAVSPVTDGGYTFYFIEVDYVPAARIENSPLPSSDSSFHERGPYTWVPVTAIESCLAEASADERCEIDGRFLPHDAKRDWLWDKFVDNLRRAQAQGVLPWNQPAE